MVKRMQSFQSTRCVLLGRKISRNTYGIKCLSLFSTTYSSQQHKRNPSGRITESESFLQSFCFSSTFNTTVDVKLQQWAEKELPRQCVEIGHHVLLDEFQSLIEREQKTRSHDPITDDLKMQVLHACRTRHQWDAKALDSLVRITRSFPLIPCLFDE